MIITRLFFEAVQWLLIGIHLPFAGMTRFLRWGTGHYLQKIYYRWVVLKRRALKEPLWQEQDWMLGLPPPPDLAVDVGPIKLRELGFVTPADAARGFNDAGRAVTRDEECDDPLLIELIAARQRAMAEMWAADAEYVERGGNRREVTSAGSAGDAARALADRAARLTRSPERTLLAKIEVQ